MDSYGEGESWTDIPDTSQSQATSPTVKTLILGLLLLVCYYSEVEKMGVFMLHISTTLTLVKKVCRGGA
jgi:hypothetical protein